MVLRNHIAYRFLMDESLHHEMVETTFPKEMEIALAGGVNSLPIQEASKMHNLYQLIDNKNQKAFLITTTVLDKLSMLKIKRGEQISHYNWTVFKNVPQVKHTYILPPIPEFKGGGCLRFVIKEEVISLIHIRFQFYEGTNLHGNCMWDMFWVNRITGETSTNWHERPIQIIEEFVYKMLCFIFLSENEEEVLKPGEKKGTRKAGKIMNDFPFPLTIVTSKWNVTSIRTEGFPVSGHFALRWSGEGRSVAKIVFINPYEKNGYIRKAASENVNVSVS